MALKDKTSLYDRHTYNTLGNTPENTSPSAGNYFTEQGASDSPFTSKAGGNDHMVKLLTKQVFSTNTGETYLPSPNGSEFQDLDAVDGGNGYFQNEHKVYGREGLPCFQCNHPIIQLRLGQRSSFFCKKCQR